jgi:hypothetical protein
MLIVQTDVDGRSYIQPEDDKDSSTSSNESPILERKFDHTLYQSQIGLEQSLKKRSKLDNIIADKMTTEESTKSSEPSIDKEIIHLEFSIGCGDVQNYLDSLKSDTDDAWFNCIIDLNTVDVIYAKTGRLQNVAEKSSRNDTATVDLAD